MSLEAIHNTKNGVEIGLCVLAGYNGADSNESTRQEYDMKKLLSLLPSIQITVKPSQRAQRRAIALKLFNWEIQQALLELS